VVAKACNPSYLGGAIKRMAIQNKHRPTQWMKLSEKQTRNKRAVAQVVVSLPSKYKTSSSIPSTEKKKNFLSKQYCFIPFCVVFHRLDNL
jgi:hypothetical protein